MSATGSSPAYYPSYPPPAPPAPPRRWLVVGAVVWGAVLAVVGGIAMVDGTPTAREQTTIASARPVVDQAIVRLAAAAAAAGSAGAGAAEAATEAGAGTVLVISGFDQVSTCRVTAARPGAQYQRQLTVYTAADQADALLDQVAAALPESYQPRVRHAVVSRMNADAGDYVALTATTADPGRVRFTASTGCRPVGGLNPDTTAPSDAERAPVRTMLSALGVPAVGWHRYSVACPGGGQLTTVEAVTATVAPGGPEPWLGRLASTTPIVVTAEVYAFRDGATGLTAQTIDDHMVLTATTRC